MKKKVILRLLTGLIVSTLAFSAAACGEEGKTDDFNQSQQQEQQQPQEKPEEEQPEVKPEKKPEEEQPEVKPEERPEEKPEQKPEQEQPEEQPDEDESKIAPVYLGMSLSSSLSQDDDLFAGKGGVYHTHINSFIYITIHFSNPEQFEVESFTLNEKKYAMDMFESGSDPENIILKVAVEDFDGVTEYTIDDIKYIDDVNIKDVKIGGDKTVKLYRDYEIEYHDADDVDLPTEYTILSDTITLGQLTRAGYNFLGWFEDENYTKEIEYIESNAKRDFDIYAKWEIITYTIEYDLDGGKNDKKNPTSYTVEDNINLADAKKNGYIFLGWFTNEEYTENINQLAGETGNLKLYACWAMKPTDGLKIEETYDGYAVTEYAGTSKDVVIPGRYFGGVPVKIADRAFYDNRVIESVTIDEGASSIGVGAFYNCSHLKSVTILEGLNSIGESAFNSCNFLQEIKIPNSVTVIEKKAFETCNSLESVVIPGSVSTIEEAVFNSCRKLKNVTISSGVKTIGNGAFTFCEKLEKITIPESVTLIDYSAFYLCSALREVVIPKSVKTIRAFAFLYCPNLEKITYNGTLEDWKKIEIDEGWKSTTLKKVICEGDGSEIIVDE